MPGVESHLPVARPATPVGSGFVPILSKIFRITRLGHARAPLMLRRGPKTLAYIGRDGLAIIHFRFASRYRHGYVLPVPAYESAGAAKNGGHTQATVQIQIKFYRVVDDNRVK